MVGRDQFRAALFGIAASLCAYSIAIALTWQGFGDWDATYYVEAALDLREFGAMLADRHWDLRYPLVLPITGSFAVLGPTVFAASLPNMIYGGLFVAGSTYFGMRYLNTRAGAILGLLVATCAPLTLVPLQIEIRGPETFFIVLSLWLFVAGSIMDVGRNTLFAAGLVAGFAWLCRETAIFLPATLFVSAVLWNRGEKRWQSLILPMAGFACVIAAELLFYTIAAGDPLYRYKVDLIHEEVAGVASTSQGLAASLAPAAILESVWAPFTRRLALPQDLPLPILGAVAFAVLAMSWSTLGATARKSLVVFLTAALVSFFSGTLLLNLESPRYFPMTDYCALMLIAVALGRVASRLSKVVAAAAIVAICSLGIFTADFTKRYGFTSAYLAVENLRSRDTPLAMHYTVENFARVILRMDGATKSSAEAMVRPSQQTKVGEFAFFNHARRPCRNADQACAWQHVSDAGTVERSWSQMAVAALSQFLPVPDPLRRNHGPLTSAIYLRVEPTTSQVSNTGPAAEGTAPPR